MYTQHRDLHSIFSENRVAFGGILIGIAIISSLLLVFSVFPGYAYVTVGRVTFFVEDIFTRFLSIFALVITVSSVLFIITVYGFNRRSIFVASTYTILYLVLYMVNKIFVIIPLYTFIITIVISEWGKRDWIKQFSRGLLYSITGLEVLALAHHISLLAGIKSPQLSSLASFETYLWAFSWPLTLILIPASIIPFLMSVYFTAINRRNYKDEDKKSPRILVLLALVLSIAVSSIGYLPTVNPYMQPLNVDWVFYYSALQELDKSKNVLSTVFNPPSNVRSYFIRDVDRPLYLLLLYTLSKVFPSNEKALCIYHNIALMLLYTFSLYFMTTRVFGKKVALYTSLVAPITPHALSFLYGGFQANLFTLSLIQIAIGLVFDSNMRIYIRLPAIASLSTIALMTHVYTWMQYLLAMSIAMIATITIAIYGKFKEIKIRVAQTLLGLVSFLAPGIVIEIILRIFSISRRIDVAWLIMQIMPILRKGLDINGLWRSMEFYINIYTGGSLNTPLYWLIFAIASFCTPVTVFGFSYVYLPLLASVALYAINPLFAYRTTLNIPTATIIAYLISRFDNKTKTLIIVTLYSLAIGKILGFIPGLQL